MSSRYKYYERQKSHGSTTNKGALLKVVIKTNLTIKKVEANNKRAPKPQRLIFLDE